MGAGRGGPERHGGRGRCLLSARRLSAWPELLRVSNAPTVVSNALVGCALAVPATSPYPWRALALAAPALVLIYSAGMALNDCLDVEVDRVERPHRPIPSGRVGRGAAVGFVIGADIAALALLALTNWAAVAAGGVLILCATLYNLLHRTSAASVLLMGACRALAVITAAGAAAWPLDFGRVGMVAGLLALYVVVLSAVARREAGNPRRIRMVLVMVCAISLFDAAVLLVIRGWPEALVAVGCFLLALGAQKRIIGT